MRWSQFVLDFDFTWYLYIIYHHRHHVCWIILDNVAKKRSEAGTQLIFIFYLVLFLKGNNSISHFTSTIPIMAIFPSNHEWLSIISNPDFNSPFNLYSFLIKYSYVRWLVLLSRGQSLLQLSVFRKSQFLLLNKERGQ